MTIASEWPDCLLKTVQMLPFTNIKNYQKRQIGLRICLILKRLRQFRQILLKILQNDKNLPDLVTLLRAQPTCYEGTKERTSFRFI